MRRCSISRAMRLIGLIAANLAVLRAWSPRGAGGEIIPVLLVGLLPLVDALILALYLFGRRYRVRPRRRAGSGYGIGLFSFVVFTATVLTILIAICLAWPMATEEALATYDEFLDPWILAAGFRQENFGGPLYLYVLVPLVLAVPLSGPPCCSASPSAG